MLKIVTAFTLAHSIPLSLATLGVVSLPSRWMVAFGLIQGLRLCQRLPAAGLLHLRDSLFYRHAILFAGSLCIMLLASVWLVERLFDLKLQGF